MDIFTQEIIKTLELLVFKLKDYVSNEKFMLQYYGQNNDEPPEILIYEDDLKPIEMTRYTLAFYLTYLEKQRYLIIGSVYDPNEINYEDIDADDVLNGELRKKLFSVNFNANISDLLEGYKKGIPPKETNKRLAFDEEKSILSVSGFKVEIARQDKITNEHKILKNIFINHKDNLGDDFYYAEIAKEEFGVSEDEYIKSADGWKRYHSACKSINEKVREATDNKIKGFLMFNATKAGKVRINREYLTVP
ncbi:MAG: hypothetical protein WC878_01025 [Candidatus Paceibacterota bacterium]|jgi:hypothetical protein